MFEPMRYKLFLLDESPAGVGAELFYQTDTLADVELLRANARNLAKQAGAPQVFTLSRAGAKGRRVYIRSVPGDAGVSVVAGMTFDSAQEASNAFGFAYNAVSYALKKAKRAGETSATVKIGAHKTSEAVVMYEEDHKAELLANTSI